MRFPLVSPNTPQRILLVEADPDALLRIRHIICRLSPHVELVPAACPVDAVERLHERQFDAVLISLAADQDAECVKRVVEHTDAPILVLTSSENEPIAIEALRNGADDYLLKHSVDCDTLRRALQCATARSAWRREIYVLSLIDELTGLYNRRGFMTLGEQQLTIAHRTKTGVNLAFADLDALKFINDHFGHSAGDRALRDTAMILKAAFHRESDLVARIGGDEFVVLWIANVPFSTESVRIRLKSALDSYVASQKLPYRLSLSIGVCHYQHDFSHPLMEMLTEVDHLMYEEKHRAKTNIA
jgi:two-component system, cell cycle response regulator